MADLVAAELRNRILIGELENGDELPPEATLLQEFGVSRPSLREALRILETEGLVRTRRGKLGGAIVSQPTPEGAAYHLGLVLQGTRVDLQDLAQARQLLEPVCVSLAAQRPDREHVAAELEDLIAQSERVIDDGPQFTASLLEFHRALVSASQNRTLEILIGALESLWGGQETAWAQRASATGAYPDEQGRQEAIKSHRRIARRIAKGDAEGASRASRDHLAASMSFVCGDANSRSRSSGEGGAAIVDAAPIRL
jgi:GntR family transcriptional repressor for pyruvate dehydrogenase complex